MTDPLVPSEVDLRGYDYMPLYGERLFKSKTWIASSPEAKIAALRLWWHSWAHEVPAASVPDNDVLLAEYAGYGLGVKAWARVKSQALQGFTRCNDGRLYHAQLSVWAKEAWDRRLDHRETTENKSERQKRWRERCKELCEQLRELGITPSRGASLETLERLLKASTVGGGETSTVDGDETSQKASVDVARDDVEIGKKRSEVKRSEAILKNAIESTQTPEVHAAKVNGAVSKSRVGQKQGGQDWDDPAYVTATAKALGVEVRIGEQPTDFKDRVFTAVQARLQEAKRALHRS